MCSGNLLWVTTSEFDVGFQGVVCPPGEKNNNLRQSPCYPDGFLILGANSVKDGLQEPMQSPVILWGKGKKRLLKQVSAGD